MFDCSSGQLFRILGGGFWLWFQSLDPDLIPLLDLAGVASGPSLVSQRDGRPTGSRRVRLKVPVFSVFFDSPLDTRCS